MLGGGVIELFFRHDTVGEAGLGGCHEGEHREKSKCGLQSEYGQVLVHVVRVQRGFVRIFKQSSLTMCALSI